MNIPSEEQIDKAATLLSAIREVGNHRPGDDRWEMSPNEYRQQLRARATDMLVILLNMDQVMGSAG